MTLIKIIPLQFSRIDFLERMLDTLHSRLNAETQLTLHPMDLADNFDPVRSQYNANEIIQRLHPLGQENEKVVGITDLDLFIPVLSYIFGQAYLGGTAALVSSHRLQNARYGLADDPELLYARLLKCILHEVGHTFGLKHCLKPGCVMISSTYVEEMDQKTDKYCPDCLKEIRA